MARKAKKEKTDVKGIHHRKMRLRGGTWDGVTIRQYAHRQRGHLFFDDELTLNSTHTYVFEQPPSAKKPGTMRLRK
jgi:hypothetical protein